MRAQATIERGACALYVSPDVGISKADIEAGFRWLETWDVLMPIKSYERLADSYGDTEEQLYTSSIVQDMRQMVYDERVLFVRHGSSADELLAARDIESDCVGPLHDACPLPMLRAVWSAKPLLLALPESWIMR